VKAPSELATIIAPSSPEREFFVDNLLVRNHCINVMLRWTGHAPWESEFPFSGSLTSPDATSNHQPPKAYQLVFPKCRDL